MGTIAEKLSYLADTKDLFKDRLNSLGANITNSTTFRDYLVWLDTFYGEVSDKTDLSVNGLVGRTSQETTKGINVYNIHNAYNITDGATIGDNEYITGTFDNTSGTSDKYLNIWCSRTDMLQTSTNYLLVCEIKSVSGTGQLYPWTKHTASAIDTQHPTNISFSSLSAGQILIYNVTTKSSFEGTNNDLRTLVRFNAGQSGSITFRLSLLTDTTITSDTFVYEPYTNGASPNPSNPQPINTITGNVPYKVSGKNLLNVTDYRDMTIVNNGTNTTSSITKDKITINTSGANYSGVYIRYVSELIDNYNSQNEYYISFDIVANQSLTFLYGESGGVQSTATIGTQKMRLSQKIDVTKNEIFYSTNQRNGDTIEISNIMISTSSDTTYEKYIQPQIFAIPLTSKNIFIVPSSPTMSNLVTYNKIDDNSFSLTSTKTGTSTTSNFVRIDLDISKLKPNTQYTISKKETLVGTSFNYAGALRTYINDTYGTAVVSNNLTFTTPSTITSVGIAFYLGYNNTTNGTSTITFYDIQLEEGSTATTYEPYYNIELCEVEDYKDKIYSSDSKFYLSKNTDKYTYKGTENWNISTNYYVAVPTNYAYSNNIPFSNYFKGIINQGAANTMPTDVDNVIAVKSRSGDPRVYIRATQFESVSDLKNWLSTHNTILYYGTLNTTTTEITTSNYPQLYAVLKQIQDYLTSYKINKEFILGYSSPEIEY